MFRCLALCAALAAPFPALAATFFTDEVSWTAAMSSTTSVALPAGIAATTFNAGPLKFTRAGSATQLLTNGDPDFWSSLIPGTDLAISDEEDVLIEFDTAVTGFAFLMHEPSTFRGAGNQTDSCNAACVDTPFTFTLYDGATSLGSFSFNAPDDAATFVGFSSSVAFDRFLIDDTTGAIDNEFFGAFRTGTIAAVPLPAGAWLMLGGLGLIGGLRMRKTKS